MSVRSRESEAGIGELVGQLVHDARSLAVAEAIVAKRRLLWRVEMARPGVVRVAAGVGLLLFALIASAVGITLAVATLIGPLAAGLLVAIVTALIGLLLLRSGAGEIRHGMKADPATAIREAAQ